jgi:hypothetical protein
MSADVVLVPSRPPRRGGKHKRALPPAEPPAPQPVGLDDWPHTTRLIPWLLAAFMAMVFLIPIDATEVKIHLPVDSKPDRFVIAAMLGALIVQTLVNRSGRRPRRRMTVVTAAVLTFGALVLTSVLVNADTIYRLGQLTFAEKALSQVLAYIGFYLIVATQVRRSEIRAFGNLMMWLAVITALGALYESRTGYNVFYVLGRHLLEPIASVEPSPTNINPTFEEGRKIIVGPTRHGLALASMLAIAMPFAVIRMAEAKTWGRRIGYLLIICLLLGAALSTGRKTAIIAPIAAFVVLVAYNRRMLRWLPVAVIVLIPVIHVASPGALGTFNVLANAGSSDSTTQRISDYSAIAPDVLRHPIIGEGYGSLDSDNDRWYRILDNEYLDEIFQVGIVGTLGYLFMVLAPLVTARGVVRRSVDRAPPIVAAAAGCAAYAVVSATFDAMSFPQAPYCFFFVAGLIAAAATGGGDPVPAVAAPRRSASRQARMRQAHDRSRLRAPA